MKNNFSWHSIKHVSALDIIQLLGLFHAGFLALTSLSSCPALLRCETPLGHIHIMIRKTESVYSPCLCLTPPSIHAACGYCYRTCVGGNFAGHEQEAVVNYVLFIRTNTSGSRVSASSSPNRKEDY